MKNPANPNADEGGARSGRGTALIEHRPSTALAHPHAWQAHALEAPDDAIDLRAYWEVIVRRKWTVITLLLIVLVTVLTATFLMTPIYRASLTLQIERQEAKVVEYQGVTPNELQGDTKDFYQTQYELLRSRSLAQRVIERLNLGAHPLYQDVSPSLGATLKAWLGGAGGGENADNARSARLVKAFLEGLTVEPVRNSRLVRIHFESPDAELATRVVNAISAAFIEATLERRMDASSYARDFLQDRLQQIKLKLEESEKALVDFARSEEIVRGERQDSVDMLVMEEFTTSLAKAQQERFRHEALYRQMEEGNVEGMPLVLENKVIQEFKAQKAKLEAQYQQDLRIYKPTYPKMLQLESQISEMQAKISEEIGHVRRGIRTAYEAAKTQERMLQAKMAESKRTVLNVQDRSIQYNILKREVDTNRQLYDGLLQRFKEVGVAGGVGINNVSIVDKGEVPVDPFKPRILINLLGALVGGLLGGLGLAFLFEHLDDTVKNADGLERLIGLPVLGMVPMVRGKGSERKLVQEQLRDTRSGFSEAYRSLRTAMQFSTPEGMPRVLMITSSSMGEGKSTTALALAINLAQAGSKVLLIDADLRKASVHKKLGLPNTTGLTNYLAGDAKPMQITRPTSFERLYVIPSGPLPPNPAELLGSEKMAALLELARERLDYVVVDGPPVLGLADAPLLGSMADATAVVVEAASTRKAFVKGALKRLHGTRTRVIGGILTKVEANSGSYYYQSYYEYGEPSGSRAAT